jgi:hypothetical protein
MVPTYMSRAYGKLKAYVIFLFLLPSIVLYDDVELFYESSKNIFILVY